MKSVNRMKFEKRENPEESPNKYTLSTTDTTTDIVIRTLDPCSSQFRCQNEHVSVS